MSLNRLIFLSLIAAYTFWINPSVPREALIGATIFAFISIGIVVHILLRPYQSTIRRIIAIVSDLATSSVQLHYVGETSSILFLLYLWITFGNGFRFGVRFLYIALAVSVVCFTVVIYTTPRWHEDILSLGNPAAEPCRSPPLCKYADPQAVQCQGAGGGGKSGKDVVPCQRQP